MNDDHYHRKHHYHIVQHRVRMGILRQQITPPGYHHNNIIHIMKNKQDIHKHSVRDAFVEKSIDFHSILDGSTPQQMWNGNQQPPYHSSMSTRLDYPNQIPQYPPRPSSQYTDAINSTVPTNNRRTNAKNPSYISS